MKVEKQLFARLNVLLPLNNYELEMSFGVFVSLNGREGHGSHNFTVKGRLFNISRQQYILCTYSADSTISPFLRKGAQKTPNISDLPFVAIKLSIFVSIMPGSCTPWACKTRK